MFKYKPNKPLCGVDHIFPFWVEITKTIDTNRYEKPYNLNWAKEAVQEWTWMKHPQTVTPKTDNPTINMHASTKQNY